MKRKIWIGITIVVVVALAIMLIVTQTKKEPGEIKIGAILVLTGPYAKVGQSAKQGIEMAIEEINGKGGIQDKKIRLIYEDDQGTPQKAVSAIRKLITVDKVPTIIGPLGSSAVLAIAPIAEKEHIVAISPTASAPEITHAGDYIFRVTYSDTFEGSKMAEYALKESKYKKIALLYINNDYGIGLKKSFKKKFKELGGQIVIDEAYDAKATDFRTHLLQIRESAPDAIYLTGYSEMGQILKQAKELGIVIPFLSCIMVEISDVVKIAKEAAERVIYTHPAYDPEKGDESALRFAKKFKKKYGTLPDPEAAFSYDAMKILTLAIERGGITADGIKNVLYQIKGYEGVTGETTFDENGDVIKSIGIKKIEKGEYIWVILRI